MSRAKRVMWGEGLFLRPQHFQQQALFHDHAVADALQSLRRHAWGLGAIELDPIALKAGLIRTDRLEIVFRDGTRYCAPRHEPLPPSRDLADIPQISSATTLYACLPELNPYGRNAANGPAAPSRPPRYRTAESRVADLYTEALDADLVALELDVRLMAAEENRDGYDCVPVARVARDASGQWSAEADFFPPLICCRAVPRLMRIVRSLLDVLLVKSETLGRAHRERATSVFEYGATEVASFWLLHTVNRSFTRLHHLFDAAPLHPEELYLALAELYGELLTFSSTRSLSDLPPYRHEHLFETFDTLDAGIRELLDTVVSCRHVVIPLDTARPSFHVGRLESDRLLDGVDFYVSVQGEMPAAPLIEAVPLKLKVGAPDDVDRILNSALRGVNLIHAAQTPAALPVRVGNHYFALEPRGAIFERMLQARSVCIYVPQTLADLKLELIAVFR